MPGLVCPARSPPALLSKAAKDRGEGESLLRPVSHARAPGIVAGLAGLGRCGLALDSFTRLLRLHQTLRREERLRPGAESAEPAERLVLGVGHKQGQPRIERAEALQQIVIRRF